MPLLFAALFGWRLVRNRGRGPRLLFAAAVVLAAALTVVGCKTLGP